MGPFGNGVPGGMMPNPGQGAVQQKINIDPSTLKDFICPNCGCEFFADVTKVKMLPRLLSPNGEAGAMFLNVGKICTQCGWTADMGTIAQMCKDVLEKDTNKPSLVEVPAGGKVEG